MEFLSFVVVEMICFVVAVSFGYAGYAAYKMNETNREMRRQRLRMAYSLQKARNELYILTGRRV